MLLAEQLSNPSAELVRLMELVEGVKNQNLTTAASCLRKRPGAPALDRHVLSGDALI